MFPLLKTNSQLVLCIELQKNQTEIPDYTFKCVFCRQSTCASEDFHLIVKCGFLKKKLKSVTLSGFSTN